LERALEGGNRLDVSCAVRLRAAEIFEGRRERRCRRRAVTSSVELGFGALKSLR